MPDAEIRVSGHLDDWIDGFENLERDAADVGRPIWQGVTDVMFGRSQEVVHIITGNLKLSGSSATSISGLQIVGQISYDEDYAIYEQRRGGNHDYLTSAYLATQRQFESALDDIWDRLVGRMG